MRVELDTNVLVSGLLNPDGAPGPVVDSVLAGRVRVLYDHRILGEYLDVLARPELDIPVDLSRAIVEYIRLAGEETTALPFPSDALPDPGALAFLEVAATGKADILVPGNLKHFANASRWGVLAMSPSAFIDELGAQRER